VNRRLRQLAGAIRAHPRLVRAALDKMAEDDGRPSPLMVAVGRKAGKTKDRDAAVAAYRAAGFTVRIISR
jgi:hypothetical protein